MKRYMLDTEAPFEIVRTVAIDIAMKHGHVAELSEAPVVVARPIWTPWRWRAVVLTLAAAPFALRYVELTSLQGFGLGWIAAAIVLLAGRKP